MYYFISCWIFWKEYNSGNGFSETLVWLLSVRLSLNPLLQVKGVRSIISKLIKLIIIIIIVLLLFSFFY